MKSFYYSICDFSDSYYNELIFHMMTMPINSIIRIHYTQNHIQNYSVHTPKKLYHKPILLFAKIMDSQNSTHILPLRRARILHTIHSSFTDLVHLHLQLGDFFTLSEFPNWEEVLPHAIQLGHLSLSAPIKRSKWIENMRPLMPFDDEKSYLNIHNVRKTSSLFHWDCNIHITKDCIGWFYRLPQGHRYLFHISVLNYTKSTHFLNLISSSDDIIIHQTQHNEINVSYDDFYVPVYVPINKDSKRTSLLKIEIGNDDYKYGLDIPIRHQINIKRCIWLALLLWIIVLSSYLLWQSAISFYQYGLSNSNVNVRAFLYSHLFITSLALLIFSFHRK